MIRYVMSFADWFVMCNAMSACLVTLSRYQHPAQEILSFEANRDPYAHIIIVVFMRACWGSKSSLSGAQYFIMK